MEFLESFFNVYREWQGDFRKVALERVLADPWLQGTIAAEKSSVAGVGIHSRSSRSRMNMESGFLHAGNPLGQADTGRAVLRLYAASALSA
ncbi:MAG: hypothetical protein OXC26_16840 [Albidovulum sp.]|nr:hypothetical protein [Albidovulum sp.]